MPSAIAIAIATMEGYFLPGSRAARNNNPGNLKAAGQAGLVAADPADPDGFAVFGSADDGWSALENQIDLDASRGLTLSGFLSKYAPSSENNTAEYISFVSQRTGLAPDDLLSDAVGSPPGANPTPGSMRSTRRSAPGRQKPISLEESHHGPSAPES